MKLFKSFLLVSLVFSSLQAFSASTAQVLILRGKVTKLNPGSTKATQVKRGEKLLEDTSVVTGEKSFVKIKFADNSTMNLGPNSKIVVSKMPEKKANMVNLLTGMIKAEVEKSSDKESKNKMLIKTRSAVMGVRGTKFQSTYNAKNKRTSLVTIEGRVAMAKQDIKQDSQADAKVEEIEKILEDSKNSVEVPAGRFSGVSEVNPASDIVSNPTIPVKIAPEQFNALAKSMDSKFKAEDVMAKSDDDIAPEGFENKKEGIVAPKAGGYVDFETGIYVAPLEKAKLDEKTGTYTADTIGTVDKTSGDYIPPKGVSVDPKKGLVINEKEMAKVSSVEDQRMLAATVREANQGVEKQGVKINQIKSKSPKSSGSSWLPKNQLVGVEFLPFSESLEVKNNISQTSAEFYTDNAYWVNLSWKQIWSEKVFSNITLGFLQYEINDKDIDVQKWGDDEAKNFVLGLGYKFSDRITFRTALSFRDEYYVMPFQNDPNNGTTSVSSSRYSMSYIDIGIDYAILKWGELDIIVAAALSLGESDVPSFQEGNQSGELGGITLQASTYYSFQKNLGLNALIRYEGREVESNDFDFNRSSLGIGLELVYDI